MSLIHSLGQTDLYQTDFDLEAIVAQTNLLQDWILEDEDRASIDLVEAQEWEGEGEHQDPPFKPLEQDLEVSKAPDRPTTRPPPSTLEGPSRMSHGASRRKRRREREKESGAPRESKKQRMEAGRVKKAESQQVQTDINVKVLKPGLKLVGCSAKVYTLAELQEMGFEVLHWDGL